MAIRTLLCILLTAVCTSAAGEEFVYRGPWKTTNRPLDGEMTCVVKSTGKHEWQGRFYGQWQGVPFDYKVDFSGPPDDLHGTATIDGVPYDWRAWIKRDRFRANFSSGRYVGSFDLERVPEEVLTAGQ